MNNININNETRLLSFSEEMKKKIEYLIDSSFFLDLEKEIYKKIFNDPEISFESLKELLETVENSINKNLEFVVDDEEFKQINLKMYNDVMSALEEYNKYNPNHKRNGLLKIPKKELFSKIDYIENYMNILYEYKVKIYNLEVLRDLAGLRNDCKINMSYYKSNDEIEIFLSQFDKAIDSGDINTAKKMIKKLQNEILEEWNKYVPNFESMTDDNFCFIGHSTYSTKFEGDFYTGYVSTSLYNQEVNDTYKGRYGFIMMPTNIVGAKSEDMYANNFSTSDEGILAYSLIAKIDHPKRILEESTKKKQENLKNGEKRKVYSEIVQKGFHPVGLFCFTNGALSLDKNYNYAKELQSNFPNLKLKIIDTCKNKKGVDLTKEKLNLINDINYDFAERHNILEYFNIIEEEELPKYDIFFENFTKLKESGNYSEDDIRSIFEQNKNFLGPFFDFDKLFTSNYSDKEIEFILYHNYALNINEILKGNIRKFWLRDIGDKLKQHIGKLNKYINGLDEFVAIINKTEITDELVNAMIEQKTDNLYSLSKIILNNVHNNLKKENHESMNKLLVLKGNYDKLQEELKELNIIDNKYEYYHKIIENQIYYSLAKSDYLELYKETKSILEENKKYDEKAKTLQEKLVELEHQKENLKNNCYENSKFYKDIEIQLARLENIQNDLAKHPFFNRRAIAKNQKEINEINKNNEIEKNTFNTENKSKENQINYQISCIKNEISYLKSLKNFNNSRLNENNTQLINLKNKIKKLFDCYFNQAEEKIKEANQFINEANYIEIKIRIGQLKREIEEILKQARMEKNKYNQNHQKLEDFVSIEQSIDEGIHKR